MTPPAAAAAATGRAGSQGRPRRAAAPAPERGLALVALDGIGRLSNHSLLDRLIRGRTWIGVIAFALIGIVTMQLWVLKLNTGIGHAVKHAALLERENALLSAEHSEKESGEDIEERARALKMVPVAPGALGFLKIQPGDAQRAAAALRSSTPSTSAASIESTTQSESQASTAQSESQASTAQSESQASTAQSVDSPSEAPSAGSPNAPSAGSPSESEAGSSAAGTDSSAPPAGVASEQDDPAEAPGTGDQPSSTSSSSVPSSSLGASTPTQAPASNASEEAGGTQAATGG